MTLNQFALLELHEVLRTADGGQGMRLMLSAMLQALVDADETAHIGADLYERTPTQDPSQRHRREDRLDHRRGLDGEDPKLRAGSFFPWLLAPRRRIDVAWYAVVT
jgi:putative transposase